MNNQKTKTKFNFKVGQWVKLIKADTEDDYEMVKGVIGIVVQEPVSFHDDNDVRVAANFKSGSSNAAWVDAKCLQAIKAPKFSVIWSTEDSDPTMLFETLAEARKFASSLKNRRGDDKAVEVGIYKRMTK